MNKLGMSLVLTCYNQQEYVSEAILSVFAQDYDGPMQLVIVDDASTDDSVRVIEETVRDCGQGWDVEIIKLTKNLGVAGATDAGWARAKYDWILIVDGDDVQLPNRCNMISEIAGKYTDIGQISFAMKCIDEGGRCFGFVSYSKSSYEKCPDFLLLDSPALNYRNQLESCTLEENIRSVGAGTAYNRKLYDKWGPLCEGETAGMRFEQDPTWAFRAALSMNVIGVKTPTVAYRSHGSNLSNMRLSPGMKGVVEFERYQEKYQKFHADSLVCMIRDLRRARNNRSLTNWSDDMLKHAEICLEKERNGCMLRYMWWSIPYYARLLRVIRDLKTFRESGTSMLRLLPFRLFCWLKYKKQQRDWKRN